jgi:hypothetical protein
MRLSVRQFPTFLLWIILSVLSSACRSEPGRVHAEAEQLVGVYEAQFDKGKERLELKSDGTYVQDFQNLQSSLSHSGRWEATNHFLGATDIILENAILSENNTAAQRTGTRILNVHRRSGKLELALNEAADWFFYRVQ